MPIIDTRPPPPFWRRDADGRFGEVPASVPPQVCLHACDNFMHGDDVLTNNRTWKQKLLMWAKVIFRFLEGCTKSSGAHCSSPGPLDEAGFVVFVQVKEDLSGPSVPFDEFVVREPAATRVRQMDGYGDLQQPAYTPRAEQPTATAREMYPQGYALDPAEPHRDSRGTVPETDASYERSDRMTAIRRDLNDWRLQRDESAEMYQYRDANVPRMRRH